ncbi:MAG: hypothetical protein AB7G06_04065 [Bdellovibrionales bacterium]
MAKKNALDDDVYSSDDFSCDTVVGMEDDGGTRYVRAVVIPAGITGLTDGPYKLRMMSEADLEDAIARGGPAAKLYQAGLLRLRAALRGERSMFPQVDVVSDHPYAHGKPVRTQEFAGAFVRTIANPRSKLI